MPLSEDQKRQIILNRGLNPSAWKVSDDETRVEPISNISAQPSVSSEGIFPSRNTGDSPLTTGLKSFGQEALPSFGGGVAAAGTAALLGEAGLGLTSTGYGALLGIPLIAAGAYLGSKGVGALQNAVEPESWQQNVAQSQALNPKAAMVGGLAALPLGGMSPSPVRTLEAAGTLGKLAVGAPLAETPWSKVAELNNLLNVGVGAGVGAGTAALQGGGIGENALIGALFNKPNAIGNRLGFHDVLSQRQQLDAALQGALVNGEQPQQPTSISAIPAGALDTMEAQQALNRANVLQGITSAGTVHVPFRQSPITGEMIPGKERVIPGKSAAESYLHMVEAQREGEPIQPRETIEQIRQRDFIQAKSEKAHQDLMEQLNTKAELDRQQAAQLATENADRALELQQSLGPKFEQETQTKPLATTELGKEIYPDYTGNIEADNLSNASESDLAERRLEGHQDKYQESTTLPKTAFQEDVTKELQGKPLTPTAKWFNVLKDWGAKFRNVDVNLQGEPVNVKTGEPVTAEYLIRNGLPTIDVNMKRAGADTLPHELGHAFMDTLRNSSRPADQRILSKGFNIISKDPDYISWKTERDNAGLSSTPEEFVATNQGYEFLRSHLNASGETPFKRWYGDLLSYAKVRFTKHGDTADFQRLLNNRLIGDAPSSLSGVGIGGVEGQKLQEESELAKNWGHWIDPSGKMIPVLRRGDSHEKRAIEILKQLVKSGRMPKAEYDALNIPFNSTTEVENALYKRNYLRGIFTGDQHYTANGHPIGVTEPTAKQRQALIDYGIEHDFHIQGARFEHDQNPYDIYKKGQYQEVSDLIHKYEQHHIDRSKLEKAYNKALDIERKYSAEVLNPAEETASNYLNQYFLEVASQSESPYKNIPSAEMTDKASLYNNIGNSNARKAKELVNESGVTLPKKESLKEFVEALKETRVKGKQLRDQVELHRTALYTHDKNWQDKGFDNLETEANKLGFSFEGKSGYQDISYDQARKFHTQNLQEESSLPKNTAPDDYTRFKELEGQVKNHIDEARANPERMTEILDKTLPLRAEMEQIKNRQPKKGYPPEAPQQQNESALPNLGSRVEELKKDNSERSPLEYSTVRGLRPMLDMIKQVDRGHGEGKTVASAYEKYVPLKDNIFGKHIYPILQASRGLSKADVDHVEKVLIKESRDKEFHRDLLQNAKQTNLYDVARESMKQKQLDQIAAKQPVTGPDGIKRLPQVDPYYWPNRISPLAAEKITEGGHAAEVLKKDFIQHQISQGNTKEQAESAWKGLETAYDKGSTDITRFAAVRKSEGVGLPDSMMRPGLLNNLYHYFNRVSSDRAFHDTFESNPDAAKSIGLENDPWDKPIVSSEHQNISGDKFVKQLVEGIRGEGFDKTERQLKLFNRIATSLMLGPLTNIHIAASSVFNAMQYTHPVGAVKGAITALSNLRTSLDHALETGYARKNLQTFQDFWNVHNTGLEKLSTLSNLIGNLSGRDFTNNFTKAYLQGFGEYLIGAKSIAANGGDKTAIALMKHLDPTWVEGKTYEGGELQKIASNFGSLVHGGHDARTLPAWMLKDTAIQPFFQLASWNIAQTNAWARHVWTPATQGNFVPLIMSTLGATLGGYVIKEARQKLSDKKSPIPSLNELVQSSRGWEGNMPLIGYNLAAMASYVGFAGALSVGAKAGLDLAYKNMPQGATFPMDEIFSNSAERVSQFVSAMINDPNFNYVTAGTRLLTDLTKENIQLGRLATAWIANAGGLPTEAMNRELNKKTADVRRWKMSEGMPYEAQAANTANPYMYLDKKQFKKTQDVGEAAQMLPQLFQAAITKADGNPEILRNELKALKENQYETMPNPERMPLSFSRYITYLSKTQGPEVAAERLQDYLMHSAINKAKASMVPSI